MTAPSMSSKEQSEPTKPNRLLSKTGFIPFRPNWTIFWTETETELDVIISSSISLVTLGTFCQRKSDVPMQNWQNFDILNGITCPMTWHCPFNSVNFNTSLPSVIFNVFPSKARNYGRSRRRVWCTVFVAHNTISDACISDACLQLGTPSK